MKILSEVSRIKKLMSINEATNPIYGVILEPFVKKAWTAFKNKYENSAVKIGQYIDNNLDQIQELNIRDLAKSKNIPNVDNMDTMDVINGLTNTNLINKEVGILIKELSSMDEFSNNIVKVFTQDTNFKKVFQEAIELEGEGSLSPQAIKNLMTDFLGETNSTKIYNELRVQFKPSKLLDSSITDEFILPASAIDELISSVSDPSLKKSINSVLNSTELTKILKTAEEITRQGTKIDSSWFKNEFTKIIQSNPSFWTQVRKAELGKILQKLYTDSKTGKFSFGQLSKSLVGGGALYVLTSIIAGVWTSSDLIDSWMGECMKSKGYTEENIDDIKTNDPNKYTIDSANCEQEVNEKETAYDFKSILSWYNLTGLLDKGVREVKFSTLKSPTTTKTVKSIDELKPLLLKYLQTTYPQDGYGTADLDYMTSGGDNIVSYEDANGSITKYEYNLTDKTFKQL
jgi:hypothetical protein